VKAFLPVPSTIRPFFRRIRDRVSPLMGIEGVLPDPGGASGGAGSEAAAPCASPGLEEMARGSIAEAVAVSRIQRRKRLRWRDSPSSSSRSLMAFLFASANTRGGERVGYSSSVEAVTASPGRCTAAASLGLERTSGSAGSVRSLGGGAVARVRRVGDRG
jgi:hypothetical protein